MVLGHGLSFGTLGDGLRRSFAWTAARQSRSSGKGFTTESTEYTEKGVKKAFSVTLSALCGEIFFWRISYQFP